MALITPRGAENDTSWSFRSGWPARRGFRPPGRPVSAAKHRLISTLNEIFLPYWEHVQRYYRRNAKPTKQVGNVKAALGPLLKTYGKYPAKGFGPLSLKTYREQLVKKGFTRQVINKKLPRVKQFFRWAVANELIPPEVHHALQAVPGLKCNSQYLI